MRDIKEILGQYKGLSSSAYALFFARMITRMGSFIWPLLTLILSRKLGYDIKMVAIIQIAIILIYIPVSAIGGKMADSLDRKKVILITNSIGVFFFIPCGFLEPGTGMLVLFVIAGIAMKLGGSALTAIIADMSKPDEREKIYSFTYLGENLGLIVGVTVGGLLFENYLNLAFIFDGLTTFISVLLIFFLVHPIAKEEMAEDEINEYEEEVEGECETAVQLLKKRKSVFIQILTFILIAFIYDQIVFSLPLYMSELYGDQGAKMYGFLTGFNAILVITCTPIITWLIFKLKELQKVMLGVGLYGLSFIIIINEPVYVVFFIMIFMFTVGEIINMLGAEPFISRRVPSSYRGRINSYAYIAYAIGSLLGHGIIGLVIDQWGFTVAFYIIGGVGLLTALLARLNMVLDRQTFPNMYELET